MVRSNWFMSRVFWGCFISLIVSLGAITAHGEPGDVLSLQKISYTEGGFRGLLDDRDLFGISIASIGDLDGDGQGDIAVGAYLDDDGGENRGAVWILFLNSDGTVKSHQKISDTNGNFYGTLHNDARFGKSIAPIGDLNSDGVDDIAVGAYFDNDGGPGRGAVWILFLNTDGTVKGYQKISDTQGSFYGSLVDWEVFGYDIASLGDLDGDGVTEIAVGAVGNNDGGPKRGGLWILHLRANGQVKSYQRINDLYGNFQGELEDDVWFGSSVESLGDLDGDGIVDIAVGSCLDNDGGLYRSGAVWILFLNVNGTVKSHQKISASQGGFSGILDERDEFGISIACMGDMDNDGIVDISVGAKADDDGGVDRGAVWLLFLNSDGTVKAFKKISNTQGGFDGVLDDSDRFGHACEYVRIQGNGKKAGLVVSSIRDDDGGDDRGAVWVMQLDVVRAPYLYVGAGPNSGIDLSASFDTIQEAIDSAETGDTILVYPGVYNESIDFGGKAITVKSALEPATIKEELVSALGGVVFANNETADSVLSNFIIEGHFNGIYCINSSPTIRNVTIVNNNYGIVALGDSTPTITSSIIWENNTAALLGCEAVYSCFPVGDGINGNIHENPQFADFSAGDYRLLSQAGRFDSGMSKWVLDDITSPCIDAGSPIANPMSEPMPNGGRVNIGAYGGSIQASRSPNQWPNAADVNRDGRVDLLDIALVAQNWLWTAPWVE